MFRTFILVLSINLLTSLAVSAAHHEEAATMGKSAMIGATGDLVVTAINHDTREVTLKNSEGVTETFVIGKEARNLDQVDVGDIVTVTAAEGVAVRLYPAGNAAAKGSISKTGVSRSDLGQKPHVTITHEVELTGKIVELNKDTRRVTIDGKEASLSLQVADDVDLEQVNKGDVVRVVMVEMLSITVNAPSN